MKETTIPLKAKIDAPMQASKWLESRVLLDPDEMEALFKFLGHFYIIQTTGLMPIGSERISQEEFLDCYFNYIESLKFGKMPTDLRINSYFSSIFTVTPQALYAVHVDETKQMVKVEMPVMQLQNHRFICGSDKKFHSMVFGSNSIYWGIQFSYPQLYQNKEMQVLKVGESPEFPSTRLFKSLQRWVREHTRPTPFLIDGLQPVNVPLRLGKSCFEWINNHPQLAAAKLKVST